MQIGVNATTADVCCYDDISVELSLKAVLVFQVIFKLTPGLRRLRSQLEWNHNVFSQIKLKQILW